MIALCVVFLTACTQRQLPAVASAPESMALPSPLALACLSCHTGPDRQRHAGDLSQLPAAAIRDALIAWRDGGREGTVMPRLARALSDSEIQQLARELGAAP